MINLQKKEISRSEFINNQAEKSGNAAKKEYREKIWSQGGQITEDEMNDVGQTAYYEKQMELNDLTDDEFRAQFPGV